MLGQFFKAKLSLHGHYKANSLALVMLLPFERTTKVMSSGMGHSNCGAFNGPFIVFRLTRQEEIHVPNDKNG